MVEAEYLSRLQRHLEAAAHLRFRVFFEIGTTTPEVNLRPLLSILPSVWKLWFYDLDHPSGSDPGAIIELERKGNSYRFRALNHGWTGFWKEASETSALNYLLRCRGYNSDIHSHLGYLILWKDSKVKSKGMTTYMNALFGLLLKEAKRSFKVEFHGDADTSKDDLDYLVENLPDGWSPSFFDKRHQWPVQDSRGAIAEVRRAEEHYLVKYWDWGSPSITRTMTLEEVTDGMWESRVENGEPGTYERQYKVSRHVESGGGADKRVSVN